MQSITLRKRTRKFTRVIEKKMLEKPNPEYIYEIPLIEFIIRKGMGRKNRERVGKFNVEVNHFEYKPTLSYLHFISKLHPLNKKSS